MSYEEIKFHQSSEKEQVSNFHILREIRYNPLIRGSKKPKTPNDMRMIGSIVRVASCKGRQMEFVLPANR